MEVGGPHSRCSSTNAFGQFRGRATWLAEQAGDMAGPAGHSVSFEAFEGIKQLDLRARGSASSAPPPPPPVLPGAIHRPKGPARGFLLGGVEMIAFRRASGGLNRGQGAHARENSS